MDIYSSNFICNHSDGEGRYSFRNQPPIGHEAIHRLGTALAEIIGCELELAANADTIVEAPRGWANDESKLEAWKEAGEKVVQEIASEFMGTYVQTYRNLMAKVSQQRELTALINDIVCADANRLQRLVPPSR